MADHVLSGDPRGIVFAAGIGIVLGALFFGGLWWTVRRLPRSGHPALLVGGSLLVRGAVVLGGVWMVMGDSWERAVACLAGFTLVRFLGVAPAALREPRG